VLDVLPSPSLLLAQSQNRKKIIATSITIHNLARNKATQFIFCKRRVYDLPLKKKITCPE
jgi:hypothetical protein